MNNSVNITDVLSQKTEIRPEIKEVAETVVDIARPSDFEESVFSKPLIKDTKEALLNNLPQEQEEEEVEELEDDTEGSAEALIDMLDLAQKSIFTILGAKKLKKKIPEKVLERFMDIDLKDMLGQELTEEEKRQLSRYKDYEKRLERFGQDIPLTEEERQQLMRCTEKFVSKNNIKIPPGVWFGVQVVSILSQRAINHIQL